MKPEFALNADKAMEAFLDSEDNFQGFGFGSQAISAGFVGKVEKLAFQEVAGAGVTERQDVQTINTKLGSFQVAEKGDNSKAPALVFDGGVRSLTLNALVQHPESTITIDGGDPLPFMKLTGKQWKSLIGYTLECTESDNDVARQIPRIKRYGKPGELEMRPTRRYTFVATK
jgi:hypothetical protein